MHIQNPFSRAAAIAAGAVAIATLTACSTPPQGTSPPFYPLPPSGQAVPPAATPPAPKPQAFFIRPAPGRTLSGFDGTRNKGMDIAGNLGDPVLAAADGRVVYVGGELRGYGNMVIVQHNDTFLTAYANAKTILVKEKDPRIPVVFCPAYTLIQCFRDTEVLPIFNQAKTPIPACGSESFKFIARRAIVNHNQALHLRQDPLQVFDHGKARVISHHHPAYRLGSHRAFGLGGLGDR